MVPQSLRPLATMRLLIVITHLSMIMAWQKYDNRELPDDFWDGCPLEPTKEMYQARETFYTSNLFFNAVSANAAVDAAFDRLHLEDVLEYAPPEERIEETWQIQRDCVRMKSTVSRTEKVACALPDRCGVPTFKTIDTSWFGWQIKGICYPEEPDDITCPKQHCEAQQSRLRYSQLLKPRGILLKAYIGNSHVMSAWMKLHTADMTRIASEERHQVKHAYCRYLESTEGPNVTIGLSPNRRDVCYSTMVTVTGCRSDWRTPAKQLRHIAFPVHIRVWPQPPYNQIEVKSFCAPRASENFVANNCTWLWMISQAIGGFSPATLNYQTWNFAKPYPFWNGTNFTQLDYDLTNGLEVKLASPEGYGWNRTECVSPENISENFVLEMMESLASRVLRGCAHFFQWIANKIWRGFLRLINIDFDIVEWLISVYLHVFLGGTAYLPLVEAILVFIWSLHVTPGADLWTRLICVVCGAIALRFAWKIFEPP